MIEIKIFHQDDGSVILETKRYDNDGIAASFTAEIDAKRQSLRRITTVKEKQIALDTLREIEKFANTILA